MIPSRNRRQGSRGQVIPLTAVMMTVLLGAVALAVDLGLQTNQRRDIQNVTDAAALAGAYDVTEKATPTNRQNAARDALEVIHDHLGWSKYGSGNTWANTIVTSQSGQNCSTGAGATVCQFTVDGSDPSYKVTVNIPPLHSHNTGYSAKDGYVEVELTHTGANSFAQIVGFRNGAEGGHSIAFHHSPSVGFGFALYAGTTVTSGNSAEIVTGPIYAYRDLSPQSNGHAAICSDTQSDGTLGRIILGSPQSGPFPSPDPAGGAAYQSNVTAITNVASCNAVSGGAVSQTAPLGSCGSVTVQGVVMTTTQDPGSLACMANPPLTAPDLQEPTITGANVYAQTNACGIALDITSPLAPGVYEIRHNPTCAAGTDLNLGGDLGNCPSSWSSQGISTCLLGVTFILENGAEFDIGGKATVALTPYAPSGSSNPSDGHFPIYCPLGSPCSVNISKNGTFLDTFGTVYMPSGSFSSGQNAAIAVTGQAIALSWTVQSGNHPNPTITWDPNWAAPSREVLQIVE